MSFLPRVATRTFALTPRTSTSLPPAGKAQFVRLPRLSPYHVLLPSSRKMHCVLLLPSFLIPLRHDGPYDWLLFPHGRHFLFLPHAVYPLLTKPLLFENRPFPSNFEDMPLVPFFGRASFLRLSATQPWRPANPRLPLGAFSVFLWSCFFLSSVRFSTSSALFSAHLPRIIIPIHRVFLLRQTLGSPPPTATKMWFLFSLFR